MKRQRSNTNITTNKKKNQLATNIITNNYLHIIPYEIQFLVLNNLFFDNVLRYGSHPLFQNIIDDQYFIKQYVTLHQNARPYLNQIIRIIVLNHDLNHKNKKIIYQLCHQWLDNHNYDHLISAFCSDDEDARLVGKYAYLTNFQDKSYVLSCAFNDKHPEIVEMLVSFDVNSRLYGLSHKDTAIMVACNYSNIEMVQLLLAAGADANARDGYGRTSLMLASLDGHKEIVEMLLSAGADVNAKGNSGYTALMYASEYDHKDIVAMLLTAGADVNAQNKYGYTALMFVSECGHKEMVAMLLAAKANVNARDNVSWTALMWASSNGHKEIVAMLLAAGADVNATSNYGRTALMLASEKGHQEIVAMLLAAKANVNARDHDGHTVMMYASGNGHKEIVDLLRNYGAR